MEDLNQKLNELCLDGGTPPWAKVLIHCLSQIVVVVNANNTLNEVVTKLDARVSQLEEDNKLLKKELASVSQHADRNEQKSRSQCLLIHGVEEKEGEETNNICLAIVNNDVGVTLNPEDIQRSHRMGPKRTVTTRNTKPRAIIFRFASTGKRNEGFYNKKKGKKIVITESLTNRRYNLLQKAKTKFGIKNVWTNEGRILTKTNNKIKEISSEDDLK